MKKKMYCLPYMYFHTCKCIGVVKCLQKFELIRESILRDMFDMKQLTTHTEEGIKYFSRANIKYN